MFSGTSQMNNQGQQWPSVGSVNTNSHMELLATLSVIFIFILITIHLYARYRRREESVTITIHHSRHPSATAPPPEGLDAAAIAALPKFIHRTRSSPTHSVEECAVCLNAAEEGEVMRMLPDCKHVFHIDCIDMWLHSHSTCPVCRTKATPGMVKIEFGGLLAAPPLPERIVVGGSTSAAETYGPKEGSSSQVSNAGNGTRTWLASVDEGVVDLERQ